MATDSSEQYYDRAKAVKEFDDAKIGVRGLLDSGITTIPRFFIHPPENLTCLRSTHPGAIQIPTVDLSDLYSNSARSQIIKQISDAASEFGFFQITNHGISVSIMDNTISAVRAFHELPAVEKKQHYNRTYEGGVFYATNYDLFRAKAATWRDTLGVQTAPVPPNWERVPAICRTEFMEWGRQMAKLGEVLAQVLCEGLGLQQDRLKEMKCLNASGTLATCYPYCPQPDLTLGVSSHTDPFLLTILMQDEVGGLQAKIGENWIDIKPIHGALVINIGDLLQIISNGMYKSVEHRVLANSLSRLSIATHIGPNHKENSDSFGPLPELLSVEKPARFRNFSMMEFMAKFHSQELSIMADNFRL
ncbi:1-aminocyclopropane-1-carboxylate oxidase homolog 4-like [Aristolochia californica]|uniref:1-aminocyclopropane-1-carboxylate oxidase homolog 4-like n=1 Tax=Aristolochia californica TaxID=171875 RepID=UPI0035D67C80